MTAGRLERYVLGLGGFVVGFTTTLAVQLASRDLVPTAAAAQEPMSAVTSQPLPVPPPAPAPPPARATWIVAAVAGDASAPPPAEPTSKPVLRLATATASGAARSSRPKTTSQVARGAATTPSGATPTRPAPPPKGEGDDLDRDQPF